MDFSNLLKSFLNSNWIIGILYVYMFLLIAYSVYSLLNYFKYYSNVQKQFLNLYNSLSDRERERAELDRQRRLLYGEGNKKDFLAKIDSNLTYSGLKSKFRWMSTETYLIGEITLISVSVIIGTLIADFIIGIIVGVLEFIVIKIFLNTLINRRDKKVQVGMIQFMNVLENFSAASDDLISILGRTALYIDEPLSSDIRDAVLAAQNTGDRSEALRQLQDKVKNKHFKGLMRNLEISARYENNYSDIIQDFREVFHAYLEGENRKAGIRKSGLLEVVAMFGVGIFCFILFNQMAESGNLLEDMFEAGLFGRIAIGVLVFSVFGSIFVLVRGILGSKS